MMIPTKLIAWMTIVLCSITFFLTSFVVWVPPAEARCYFIFFCPLGPSNFTSKGGVRRGPCAAEEFGLIALAPGRKPKALLASTEKVESTVEGYPTFWFYVMPYKPSIKSATSVKFVLLDESRHMVEDPLYAQLPQASNGVIAGLTLPSKGKALEVGKHYSWYFSILCDSQKPSRNPEVTGQIQRVLQSPLPNAKEPAYIVHDTTYTGQDGLESVVFYDTVNQLVRRRSTYASDWKELLSQAEVPSSNEAVELRLLEKPPENCDSSNNSTV